MVGTIEALIEIKEEALENIPNLSKEELFLFNKFLIDLLKSVNREMRHQMTSSHPIEIGGIPY